MCITLSLSLSSFSLLLYLSFPFSFFLSFSSFPLLPFSPLSRFLSFSSCFVFRLPFLTRRKLECRQGVGVPVCWRCCGVRMGWWVMRSDVWRYGCPVWWWWIVGVTECVCVCVWWGSEWVFSSVSVESVWVCVGGCVEVNERWIDHNIPRGRKGGGGRTYVFWSQ